jgi:hypothetical protein
MGTGIDMNGRVFNKTAEQIISSVDWSHTSEWTGVDNTTALQGILAVELNNYGLEDLTQDVLFATRGEIYSDTFGFSQFSPALVNKILRSEQNAVDSATPLKDLVFERFGSSVALNSALSDAQAITLLQNKTAAPALLASYYNWIVRGADGTSGVTGLRTDLMSQDDINRAVAYSFKQDVVILEDSHGKSAQVSSIHIFH